ncbi:hypothetical protein [Streptomyces sp. NBC_00893]|uniref:hypothetical protein n=1 Tax=Streptomyces sp. NBC_00893 TaxID=2975862 RepID=UPI0022567E7D|nr:hypothetical protein [Streptomyces sp. NBC_00893]MCX4844585.1 hypothetical protein [Streptomyces sp. NBC_00893]
MSSPDDEEWLDTREVELLCERAESEIASGAPGDEAGRLRGLTARVREEWGERRPLVRRVWRGAADGLRLAGEPDSAVLLYLEIADALIHGDGPEARAGRLEIGLRVAECLLPSGELDRAITAVDSAGRTAAGLPPELAARVEAVRREVDLLLAAQLAEEAVRRGRT